MSSARVLSITVPVEVSPATTFFQIRFNVDGSVTWTGYDPGNASPSQPADINVSTLSAGVYLLDGVNGLGGNQAAASYAGNWYQLRLKSAGGYGDWSAPFKIVDEPDTAGPLADVAALLSDFADLKIALDFATQEQADEYAGGLLNDAMDALRVEPVLDTLYTGAATTAAQFRRIARAERYQAMSIALEKAMTMKALGMQAPLLMEDSSRLEELSVYFQGKVNGLLVVFETGDAAAPMIFARPAVSSGTYAHARCHRCGWWPCLCDDPNWWAARVCGNELCD